VREMCNRELACSLSRVNFCEVPRLRAVSADVLVGYQIHERTAARAEETEVASRVSRIHVAEIDVGIRVILSEIQERWHELDGGVAMRSLEEERTRVAPDVD